MKILGLKIFKIQITDPTGAQTTLTFCNEKRFISAQGKMIKSIEELLKDEAKFKKE